MIYTCHMKPPTGNFTVGRDYTCVFKDDIVSVIDNDNIKVLMEKRLFLICFRHI